MVDKASDIEVVPTMVFIVLPTSTENAYRAWFEAKWLGAVLHASADGSEIPSVHIDARHLTIPHLPRYAHPYSKATLAAVWDNPHIVPMLAHIVEELMTLRYRIVWVWSELGLHRGPVLANIVADQLNSLQRDTGTRTVNARVFELELTPSFEVANIAAEEIIKHLRTPATLAEGGPRDLRLRWGLEVHWLAPPASQHWREFHALMASRTYMVVAPEDALPANWLYDDLFADSVHRANSRQVPVKPPPPYLANVIAQHDAAVTAKSQAPGAAAGGPPPPPARPVGAHSRGPAPAQSAPAGLPTPAQLSAQTPTHAKAGDPTLRQHLDDIHRQAAERQQRAEAAAAQVLEAQRQQQEEVARAKMQAAEHARREAEANAASAAAYFAALNAPAQPAARTPSRPASGGKWDPWYDPSQDAWAAAQPTTIMSVPATPVHQPPQQPPAVEPPAQQDASQEPAQDWRSARDWSWNNWGAQPAAEEQAAQEQPAQEEAAQDQTAPAQQNEGLTDAERDSVAAAMETELRNLGVDVQGITEFRTTCMYGAKGLEVASAAVNATARRLGEQSLAVRRPSAYFVAELRRLRETAFPNEVHWFNQMRHRAARG
jgi:hypothetical protein